EVGYEHPFGAQRDDALDGMMQGLGIELYRAGRGEYRAPAVRFQLPVCQAEGIARKHRAAVGIHDAAMVACMTRRLYEPQLAPGQLDAGAFVGCDDALRRDGQDLAVHLAGM